MYYKTTSAGFGKVQRGQTFFSVKCLNRHPKCNKCKLKVLSSSNQTLPQWVFTHNLPKNDLFSEHFNFKITGLWICLNSNDRTAIAYKDPALCTWKSPTVTNNKLSWNNSLYIIEFHEE